jgi:hypothetical protein
VNDFETLSKEQEEMLPKFDKPFELRYLNPMDASQLTESEAAKLGSALGLPLRSDGGDGTGAMGKTSKAACEEQARLYQSYSMTAA